MNIKIRHVLMFSACAAMTGCSTIDWKGTGERWHKNKQREECQKENKAPCPIDDIDVGHMYSLTNSGKTDANFLLIAPK